jgi:FKBP-type peptidyl-prolyl cis-trans isomerase 2
MAVEAGNKVKVDYVGTLEDGEVFDSSENHGQPMEFIVGHGQLIEGFDKAVVGMEVGDEKEITLPPEEAYGEILEELVRDFPKEGIPDSEKLAPGVTLIIGLPNGFQIAGRVIEVADESVKIDMNHPLAGQTLNFKIKVLEISEPTAEELQQGCGVPGCGHDHGEEAPPEEE